MITPHNFESDIFKKIINLIGSGKINISLKTNDDATYDLFIKRFPKERLEYLTQSEYCLDSTKNTDKSGLTSSFCHWIEYKLRSVIGGYFAGTARSHLIYIDKDGVMYKNPNLASLDDDDAVKYVTKIHSIVANANPHEDLKWLDSDAEIYKKAGLAQMATMGIGRKLRLVSIYNPETVLPIASSPHLKKFLIALGLTNNEIPGHEFGFARLELLTVFYKKALELYPQLTPRGFTNVLYSQELGLKIKDEEADEIESNNDSDIIFDKSGIYKLLVSKIKPGIEVGDGTRSYKVEKMTRELFYLKGKAENRNSESMLDSEPLRLIPTDVVIDVLNGILQKKVTLNDIRRDRVSKAKPNIFEMLNLDYDTYLLGYDSTIYKICEYILKDLDFSKVEIIENNNLDLNRLNENIKSAGLVFRKSYVDRLVTLLTAKSFVILTGLSGSGKTKIAQAFSIWICQKDNNQCLIVPVGADWTNREPLLGYPNALNSNEYIKPDSGVIDLLIAASKDENKDKPYFLILDEMNLSHVERYFADFLSLMESGEDLKLHSSKDISDVPKTIKMPKNLFVIGTVNIDETTYMFSPKVLDRAGVIEFRVDESEMQNFLENPAKPDLDKIAGLGASMAADFVRIATKDANPYDEKDALNAELIKFFAELKKVGAEFGYRTAFEINRFAGIVSGIVPEGEKWSVEQITDAAIIQKLLPKLHGSQRKLSGVLKTLAVLCLKDALLAEKMLDSEYESLSNDLVASIKYPLSFEKIHRMYQRAKKDGFTSFAEA